MSDSEYDSTDVSSVEEPRPTPIKITKAKKPKINETVAKIIDKEKTKANEKKKRITEAKNKSKLQNPVEPVEEKPDPRDKELMDIKEALESLKVKFISQGTPTPAPESISTAQPVKPLKEKKPRAPRVPKEKPVAEKAPKVNAVIQPVAPRPLTRDEILRSILFS